MKFLDWFARSAASEPRARIYPTFRAKRSFDGAKHDRTTESWLGSDLSIDQDLYRALMPLRARSRDLFHNNPFAKRFGHMVKTNVIGPNGFKFQVRGMDQNGQLDSVANAGIEKAFKKWSKRGICEITHKLSFVSLQQMMIRNVARDGECLVRKLIGGAADNEFGFALQLLDIARLDINHNRQLDGGAIIKMGVELNPAGRPIAYHLLKADRGSGVYSPANGRLYERVPATEIYHMFIADDPTQTRGIPWVHAAMTRLRNLGKYDEAALIAARVGASKMGFFTTPQDGDTSKVVDAVQVDGATGETTALYAEAEPGTFGVLPEGYGFENFDPDYPHANYDPFTKAMIRGVSVGLNVSYPMFSHDLQGVNFSSIRTGVLADRDEWMILQGFHIEGFLEDLGQNWLRMALLFGQIEVQPGTVLSSARFEKFADAMSWLGRRWPWVDPAKDQKAGAAAIADKTKSRTQIMAQAGDDINEVWADIAREKELAEKLGIDLPTATVQDLSAPEPDDSIEDDAAVVAVTAKE